MTIYIERILGYVHDDYNYAIVNKLIDREVKSFMKKIVCYPKQVDKESFQPMYARYTHEEIIHIILLVTMAKTRTQTTFLALRIYDIIKLIE
jgi:hypothetical protein